MAYDLGKGKVFPLMKQMNFFAMGGNFQGNFFSPKKFEVFSKSNFDKYSQKVTRDFLQASKFNKFLQIGAVPRKFWEEDIFFEFWSWWWNIFLFPDFCKFPSVEKTTYVQPNTKGKTISQEPRVRLIWKFNHQPNCILLFQIVEGLWCMNFPKNLEFWLVRTRAKKTTRGFLEREKFWSSNF